ncbi:MAG: type II toxin-antitoxin system RelE/ParE family toxin [Phycisphaeraceae bacterium]|nr:type II toxin-antitoxin system RelE/ParE family toxin [Phycisphaeraceae bacterium]
MPHVSGWQIQTTRDFDDWFAGQDESVRESVAAVVEVLRQWGPTLGRPWADKLKGSRHANMKELRPDKAHGQVVRIAFAFDPRREAILLTAGAKQGRNQRRFYVELVRQADKLYDEHLAKLKTR